jgi:orotidine-5'-phosphate decarboxylase
MEESTRLCLALDADLSRLPPRFRQTLEGISDFLATVIEITKPYVAAYKINLAFYEVWGSKGYQILEKLFPQIPYGTLLIADGKRSDIENTAKQYARGYFENWPFDAVTVNPYLGYESIAPFLEYEEKRVYLVALTSNLGAKDFQLQKLQDDKFLYQLVVEKSLSWERKGELGFVVGATQPEEHLTYFQQYPNIPLLIPGFGFQGKSLDPSFPLWNHPDTLFVVGRSVLYPQMENERYEEALESACKEWAEKTRRTKAKKST